MLSGPVAFTRDHLDAGAMAHPNIMTENMRDGSDAIADWPLLNAMVNCARRRPISSPFIPAAAAMPAT